MVEASQVEAAILNLALNARDAMPDGGTLTIATSNRSSPKGRSEIAAGDYVAITVTDTGVGMTDEVAQRAFEPFFTTKGTSGSGLGLSQVYRMVRESGGAVRLVTAPGMGTSVTLLLPRAVEMPRSDRPHVVERRPQSKLPVLVVDDDRGRVAGDRRHAAPARLSRYHGNNGQAALALLDDATGDRHT